MNKVQTTHKTRITFLVSGLVMAGLLLFGGLSVAQAAVTVAGDSYQPSGQIYLEIYDTGGQANPCTGTASAGNRLAGDSTLGTLVPDANYNDGNDYSLSFAQPGTNNIYMYFCNGTGGGTGNLLAYYTRAVVDTTTYQIDLATVYGNSLNGALNGDYAVVCDELDGTKLSSVQRFVAGGAYEQFYFKDQTAGALNNNTVYILINNDGDDCTFDSNVTGARQVDITSGSAWNIYGVSTPFSPDTAFAADLHADLTVAQLSMVDASANSIGIGEAVAVPDGLDDANDDLVMYYDDPGAAMTWTLSKTGTITPQTLASVPTATANLDFVVAVEGTVPADIDYVSYDDAVGGTTHTHSTVPAAGAYDLYVPDDAGGNNEVITMKVGGSGGTTVIVFNNTAPRITEDATCTAGNFFAIGNVAVAGDQDWDGDTECATVDVAKVYGTMDDTFATAGANERIRVVDDYTKLTAFGGVANEVYYDTTGLTISPAGGGEEYKVYFAIHFADDVGAGAGTADTTYDLHETSSAAGEDYISILNNWTTTITAGTSTALNLEQKLSGDTPDAAGEVVYLTDGAGGAVEAGGVTAASGLYEIYTDSKTGGANEHFDYESPQSSNVLRIDSGGTDFSADYQFDVSKVTGDEDNIHDDLNGNTWDVRVSDAAADNSGALLSSTWPNIDPGGLGDNSETYTTYFQVPTDGLVDFGVFNASTLTYFVYNITTAAGTTYTFEPNAKLVATVPGNGDNVEAVSDVGGDAYQTYRDNDNQTTKTLYIDTTRTTDTTGTYNLYTDDTFATLVLTRGTKDLTAAAQTWDVAKATGALHANLQTDDDYVRVCTDTACGTVLSSADPTMTGGTYTIYYEISGAGTDVLHVFDKDGDPDYNSYIDLKYWNNPMAGTNVAAGDTDTIALTTLNDGTVHADILWVWVDSDGTEDALWILAGQVASDGIYRMYSNYAAQNYYKKFDDDAAENTGTPNVNLEVQELMSVQTLNVDRLVGDAPTMFNADVFELDDDGVVTCNSFDYGGSGGRDTLPANNSAQTPDYYLYVEADSTTYHVGFCDTDNTEGRGAHTKFLDKTFTASAVGAQSFTIDASRVGGETLAELETAGDGADKIEIFSDATCTTEVSSEYFQGVDNGFAGTDDYAQVYESTGAGNYYAKATSIQAGPLTYSSCILFAGSAAGSDDTLDITVKLTGTAHTDVLSMAADLEAGGDGTLDSVTAPTAVTGVYQLYTPAGTATALARAYDNANPAAGNLLLSRTKNLSANATMDVNRVTGNIHDDFDNAGNDNVAVYDADTCTTLLSSEDFVFVEAGTDTYTQYYERTGNNITLQITRTSGGNDYVTCFATETVQPAAGNSTTKNLTVKVDGTVPDDIDDVQIDPDEDAVFEITQNIVETDPDTYKIYFDGDAASDVQWRDGATVELSNLGAADANVDLSTDVTINLASVTGTANADIQIADAVAVCKLFPAAGSCQGSVDEMSSAAETPGATYEQHFYIDPAATYFVVETTTATPSYSYARIDSVTAGATLTVDLDAKLSGDTALVPTAIDFIWLDTATANSPATVAEYAAAAIGAGDYALYYDSVVTAGDLKADTGRDVSVAEADGLNVVLVKSKDPLPATWYVGSAYGATHANLSDTTGTVTVCDVDDDYSVTSTNGVSCTTVMSSATVNPNAAAFPGANDYAIYYEMVNAGGNYWLKITDSSSNHESYAITASAAGDRDINTELDGILSGTTREAYDNTTPIGNVFVGIYATGWDAVTVPDNTNIKAFGYSLAADGTYIVYTDAGANYDFEFKKDSYITQSAATNNDGTNTLPSDMDTVPLAVGVTVDLVAGIKVTVNDGGGNPITDAMVSIYTCTNNSPATCTTLGACTNPADNCTRTGDNTAGNGASGEYYFSGIANGTYVQIRVTDPTVPVIFDAIWSPDPSEAVNSFQTSAAAAINATVVPYNPAPQCSVAVIGGAGTYLGAGTLYADVGQNITLDVNCGVAGLTVTANLTNIGGGAAQALVDDTDGTYSYTGAIGAVATGSKAITVTATDNISNTDTDIVNVYVDNTAPNDVAAVNDPGASVLVSDVTWNWAAVTDADSGLSYYNIQLDDAAGCASPIWTRTTTDTTYTVAGLTDGTTYYFCVQTVDHVGNTGSYVASDGVLIDISAPAELSLVIEGGADYTNDKDALTLTFVGQDVTTYALSCDGTTWVNLGASPQDIDLDTFGGGCTVANGNKVFYLRATDANGNTEDTFDEIVLDNVAPTIGVLTAANVAGERAVTLTWTAATDATSGISYYDVYRDPATGVNKTDTKIASGLTTLGHVDYPEDGAWYYTVYATDKAGNESVLFVEKTVTVDTTAVNVVATPPFGTYNAATLAAAGGVSVTPDATGTCKWDTYDADYANMGAVGDKEFAVGAGTTYDLTVLADADDYTVVQGLNEIYVRCRDANNNDNPAAFHISFYYDTVAPDYQLVSVASDGNGRIVGGVLYANQGDTVTVRFQSLEALAGNPTVTIGGQAMTFVSNLGGLYTYNRTLTNAETTSAIITIAGQTDVAGNDDTDFTDGGANVEFDFTAPVLVVTAPGTQNSKSFLINVTTAANSECRMDQNNIGFDAMSRFGLAETAAGTFQGTYIVDVDGAYTIYVVCRDYAGNDGIGNTGAFQVSTTEPSVLTLTPNLASGWQIVTPVAVTITTDVNATCKYDDNEAATYALMDNTFAGGGTTTHTANIANLGGTVGYYVLCQNTFGVTMTQPVMLVWKGDVTVPSAPVRFLPATGQTYQTGSILAWGGSLDADSGVASYELQIDNDNAFGSPEINLAGLATTAYELTAGNKIALNAGVNYWRARAVDNAGNNGTWTAGDFSFLLDKTAPTVEEMLPADDATGVAVSVLPLLVFDEQLELSTVGPANIQLRKYADDSAVALDASGGVIAENVVTEDAAYKTYVYLVPAANLDYNTQYYITVSAAVVDLSGNAFTAWAVADKANHEFTTAAQVTGALGVMGITQTKSWGTADDTWANGWEWVIRATIPTDELGVALKFNNWTGVGATTIAVANNMRYFCPQSAANQNAATAVTIAAAATYPADMTIVAGQDLEADLPGIQVDITVQAKIPAGSTAGAYSTSYGLRSQ